MDDTPEIEIQDQSIERLLSLYSNAISQLQYEGVTIWRCFNYLMTINLSLLGFTSYTLIGNSNLKYSFSLVASLVGFCFAVVSIIILDRLWDWRDGWQEGVKEIENSFNGKMPKLFQIAEKIRSIKEKENLILIKLIAVQHFFYIIAVVWSVIFIFSLGSLMKYFG